MEKRFNEAAIQGNLPSLLSLLRDDPLLLDRSVVGPYSETPLHIAAMLGHMEFVREILSRKPELASELNSQGSSPLHLASAKGYLHIVKNLLTVNPGMCFSRDKFGRNPVHVSAVKGRVDALKEMVRVRPEAALQRTNDVDTILHLCVKNNKLDCLKVLLESPDVRALVNSKNGDGDTILHLAAADKQSKTINFLINNTDIDRTAPNQKGLTALDVLLADNENEIEMAAESPQPGEKGQQANWLEKMSSEIMIVATLAATMAFELGVNPPGGVWQDTTQNHTAGRPIMTNDDPFAYNRILGFNTISFVASLSIIILLISGLPLTRRLFMWVMMVIMWVAIICIAVAYLLSIWAITPHDGSYNFKSVASVVMLVWMSVITLLLVAHLLRQLFENRMSIMKKWNTTWSTSPVSNHTAGV